MVFPGRLQVRRRRLAADVFIFGLLAGLLGGCAIARLEQPHVVAVTPQVLQQGKAATLSVQVEQWVPGSQLALMSAGPYVTHHLLLPAQPVALASDGQRAFVASADRRLSTIDFPPQTDSARVLGQLTLAAPAKQIQFAQERLLVLLNDDRLQWLDVSSSAAPKVLSTVPAPGRVRDLQLDSENIYLLLETDGSQARLQRWKIDNDQLRFERQWSLPLAVRAFAVRGQQVWAVGADGVAALVINGEQAVVRALQAITGVATDIQLREDLALVAAGRGGLVVFDVSQPDVLRWRGSFNKRGAIRGFSVDHRLEGDIATGTDDALLTLGDGTLLGLGLDKPELPSSGASFRTEAPLLSSVLSDDVALLATEAGLQRVIMQGGGDGAISPEGLNLGGSRRGVIRDDILYVADWFSGLHLYDISNPRQLRHLSNYHTPGSSKGVTLMGNYALVGDDDQGLQIIDIEDPLRPQWTSELPPSALSGLGLAYTMKRVGKTLYLADHRGGFHIIDLSDIYHPKRLGGYDTPGKAWDIDVKDNVAFVADDRGGLLMFDVTNPTSPQPFAQFNPGGQAEDVALQDGRAYVAFFDLGLYTLDISNPRQARVIGHTPIPGNARGIELADGLLYVASWEAGLQIVDTRGPRVPQIIGSFDTDGAAWGVKAKDGFAYVLDWWGGVKVVDVRQPSRPTAAGRYHARGTLQQLRTRDTYLYAASGAGGLQVYDIKNPLNPIWLKGLDIDGQAQDVWIEDERVYVAAGDGGVAIFDTLDPFYTRQIGAIDTPGAATKLVAGNEYLYIADHRAGLLVMDVRDPQRPVEVVRYDRSVQDMWLDGQTLWIVHAGVGLSGWAVKGDGRLVQRVSLPGKFSRVRAQDKLLVSSNSSGAVSLWRLTPQGPVQASQFVSGDAITDLQLGDDSLYVLGLKNGLSVVDIAQPESPRLVTVYPPTGNHTNVAIARGAAFFAGENRLASVDLLPALAVTVENSQQLAVGISKDLPLGRYHLLALSPDGQRRLLPNALKIQFAAPGKKNATLDAFRQLLKAPLKPPEEPGTELPSVP